MATTGSISDISYKYFAIFSTCDVFKYAKKKNDINLKSMCSYFEWNAILPSKFVPKF